MKGFNHGQEQSQLQDGREEQDIGHPHQKPQGRGNHEACKGGETIHKTHAVA